MTQRDHLSREELRSVLKAAADKAAVDDAAELVSMADAEHIANSVGISTPQFRAAVAELRAPDAPTHGWLGPASVITATEVMRVRVTSEQAAQLLSRGQIAVGSSGGSIEVFGEGVYRLAGDDGAVLQVVNRADGAEVTASIPRRHIKVASFLAGGLGGYIGGSVVIGSAVTLGLHAAGWTGFGAIMAGQYAALIGGVASGVWAGRALWQASARRHGHRLRTAIRTVIAPLSDNDSI